MTDKIVSCGDCPLFRESELTYDGKRLGRCTHFRKRVSESMLCEKKRIPYMPINDKFLEIKTFKAEAEKISTMINGD